MRFPKELKVVDREQNSILEKLIPQMFKAGHQKRIKAIKADEQRNLLFVFAE